MNARLSPTGYLGLHLTLGQLAIRRHCPKFVSGDPLTLVDAQVAAWFHARDVPSITHLDAVDKQFARRLWDHNPRVPAGAFCDLEARLLLGACAGPRRARRHAAQCPHEACIWAGTPEFDDSIFILATYSSPSGYVAPATLLYGLLTAFLIPRIAEWRWRVLVLLVAVLIISQVGLSRVNLGARYLSDVLAAFAEGIAWLSLRLTALLALRRCRAALHAAS